MLRAARAGQEDGLALSFMLETDTILTTIFESAWTLPAPSEPLQLPPLSEHCLGQAMIGSASGFDIAELGGIETGPRGPADLVTAEVRGLQLRYDQGPGGSGATCATPNLDCGLGPTCPSACEGAQSLGSLLTQAFDVRSIRLRRAGDEQDAIATAVDDGQPVLQIVYGAPAAFGPFLPREEAQRRILTLPYGEPGATAGTQRRVRVGDLNADGLDDFVVWRSGSTELRAWLGGADVPLELGAGLLERGATRNCSLFDVVFGDLDGDGTDELALSCADGSVYVY